MESKTICLPILLVLITAFPLLVGAPASAQTHALHGMASSLAEPTALCLPDEQGSAPAHSLLMSFDPFTLLTDEETTAKDEKAAMQALVPVAVEGARDELHALINASKPDTWTCRRKPTKILTYEEMPEKLQRRTNWWWYSSELLRERFGHDITYWREMQPLYKEKKVCNLRTFMIDGLTSITFLGVELKVNSAVAPKLKRVERRLIDQGFTTAPFELSGGFFPRTTRGPFGVGKHLSRHGLGIAIDFDWDKNPYFSRRELNFVQELTGIQMKRDATIPAGKRWDSINRANILWNERIGPWLEETQRSMEALEKTPRGRHSRQLKTLRNTYNFVTQNRNLSRAIDKGFLSLPRAFVVAMEAEGLTWATDFPSGPDFMHFEDRDYKGNPNYRWTRKRSKRQRPHVH
ncbi:MAG: M15 family metallopeptidase [Myxococcota bacterium]